MKSCNQRFSGASGTGRDSQNVLTFCLLLTVLITNLFFCHMHTK